MAVDLIKIYISELRSKVNFGHSNTLEQAIFHNGFIDFKFIKQSNNKYLSYYEATVDEIYIKYFPYYKKGQLRIKFNIPKLIAGTNLCSIFIYNTQQLFERLCYKLWPLIDLVQAPHIRYWSVSEVEVNLDIIKYQQEIDSIFHVLEKTKSTDKYIQHKRYDDGKGGKTLYFIPKGSKFDTSDIVIKFYMKVAEQINNNQQFDLNDLYDSYGIVKLLPNQKILRMEVELRRDKIHEHFKPKMINNPSGVIAKKCKSIGIFEEVFTMDYQLYILNGLIKEFNLNKKIVTCKDLKNLIRNNKNILVKHVNTYWNVINYKNTNSHKKKPFIKVHNKCLKYVLSAGYNYLYGDTVVEPILIEDIIKNLPEAQQVEIGIYRNSSIFKDIQLSMLPNPRVYKGKRC